MEFGKKKMNRPFLRCAPTCYLVGWDLVQESGTHISSISIIEYLDLRWYAMVQDFLHIMVHVFKDHVYISPVHVIICICLT
jgi:hypothetical protein